MIDVESASTYAEGPAFADSTIIDDDLRFMEEFDYGNDSDEPGSSPSEEEEERERNDDESQSLIDSAMIRRFLDDFEYDDDEETESPVPSIAEEERINDDEYPSTSAAKGETPSVVNPATITRSLDNDDDEPKSPRPPLKRKHDEEYYGSCKKPRSVL